MNRICPRCQRVYSYALGECPNGCSTKRKKESNKIYDQTQRKNKDFYDSKEWRMLREACRKKFDGLCVWSFYKHKRLVKGTIAHHIVMVEEDKGLALNLDNLIFVSDEAHREIHTHYDIPGFNKRIHEKLFDLVDRWEEKNNEGWGTWKSFESL